LSLPKGKTKGRKKSNITTKADKRRFCLRLCHNLKFSIFKVFGEVKIPSLLFNRLPVKSFHY